MRKTIALAAGLFILGFVNFGIYQRERLLTDGRIVLLRLSPVDPRSMMQGDYMRLNFEAADLAFPFGHRPDQADGQIVVAVDPHGIASFRRFAGTRPLAPDEIALRYRIRSGRPKFATDAYFFQEGKAELYQRAQFGEFRVAEDGEMILTGLRDASLARLGDGTR